jgi:hypothetical protein
VPVLAAVLFATALTAAAALTVDGSPDAPERWGEPAAELIEVLEAKARQYAVRARGFTCTERIRRAEYEGRDVDRERYREYEYLLVPDRNEPGGYSAYRSRPGSDGANEERPDVEWPEPLLWSQVFDPAVRSTLMFKTGDLYTTPYKLALPVSWISSAPVIDRTRITEWSGVAEVEYRTGNLISITAEPNLQEEKILAELRRFMTSFRFLGFSSAPAPLGQELTVRFDYEHEGMTYPSRIELRTFRQTWRDTREIETKQRIDYVDYRFFATDADFEVPPLLYDPRRESGEPR